MKVEGKAVIRSFQYQRLHFRQKHVSTIQIQFFEYHVQHVFWNIKSLHKLNIGVAPIPPEANIASL